MMRSPLPVLALPLVPAACRAAPPEVGVDASTAPSRGLDGSTSEDAGRTEARLDAGGHDGGSLPTDGGGEEDSRAPSPGGPPGPGECGGCEAGAVRCVSHRDREVCAADEGGCLRWRAAEPCGEEQVCWGAGECQDDRSCGYVHRIERCVNGAQRRCMDGPSGRVWSAASACDSDVVPPHCDALADLGVLHITPHHGVGACVQLSARFEGPCGPCSWHQCVVDEETGEPHFRCVSRDWSRVRPDQLPPGPDLGYACPEALGGPIQGDSKVKRGGTNPWTVLSHYNGGVCVTPEGV